MRIKSNEREPFIQALHKLRPDLKKTVSELEDQLGVFRDDIADLLGRLQRTGAPPESGIEQRDAGCTPQPSTSSSSTDIAFDNKFSSMLL